MADIARRHMISVQVLERAWGQVFSAEEIAAALARAPVKVVAIVHAETSTGVVQPLDEIAQVVHESGALLLVDAVTSLGGIPIDVDRIGIDVCYSCSQKCLGSPPGLGPISLGPRAIDVVRRRQTPVSPFYLDLGLLWAYWTSEHAYHHTAPISSAFAFHEALRIVHEEGLSERYARHVRVAQLLCDGLKAMGLELFVPSEHRLPTLTTVRVPARVNEAQIRRRLLEEYNIEIGGGLGELKGKVWRIGLMGHSCSTENVLQLLAALERLLADSPA
jgi:alanine-glyoxylate transaminase/serine-glyoxylate transaminase/serine-pyruvate transaminase